MFYGAALLGRLGRSPTSPAVAPLTSRPAPSMMDVVDLARDVVGSGDERSVAELAAGVRRGLAHRRHRRRPAGLSVELVATGERPARHVRAVVADGPRSSRAGRDKLAGVQRFQISER